MLVLSRKKNEQICCKCECGRFMRVTVVDIRGDKVRLGFDASRLTAIHRQEVYEAIQREQAREPGQVLRLDPPHLESKETQE